MRQFLVTGRKLNGENGKENETYAMRVFARNEVFAKSNFLSLNIFFSTFKDSQKRVK